VTPGPTTRDYERIFDHCVAITETIELRDVLAATLRAVSEVLPEAQVLVCEVERGVVRVLGSEPPCSAEALATQIPVGAGLVGRAAADRGTIYAPDLRTDPRVAGEARQRAVASGDRSFLAIPLVVGDNLVGVLAGVSSVVDAFSASDCTRVLALAPTIAAGMRNAFAFERERAAWKLRRQLEVQKGLFLSLVSAELIDPLMYIRGLCEHARAVWGDEQNFAAVAELGREMLHRGQTLAALVEEVLEIAISDGVTGTLEEMDIGGLLVAAGYLEQSRPIVVRAHRGRLERALARLVQGGRVELEMSPDGVIIVLPTSFDLDLLGAIARLVGGYCVPGIGIEFALAANPRAAGAHVAT
jgi:signal transduction histidine kinase